MLTCLELSGGQSKGHLKVGIIFKRCPISAPFETQPFGLLYHLLPIRNLVQVSIPADIPGDAFSVGQQQCEVDRQTIIMIAAAPAGVGHNVSLLGSSLRI
ncbi:hypothetical protein D3C81_2107300 [compost metagenome]